MKTLRARPRIRIVLLILLLVFSGLDAYFGVCALFNYRYWAAADMEEIPGTFRALESRADSVAELFSLYLEQETLENLGQTGEDVSYHLSLLDRQIQEAEEALSAENTNFRWEVTDISGNWQASNLSGARTQTAVTNLSREICNVREATFLSGDHMVSRDSIIWQEWSPDDPSEDNTTDGNLTPADPSHVIHYGIVPDISASTVSDEFRDLFDIWQTNSTAFPGQSLTAVAGALIVLLLLFLYLGSCGYRDGAVVLSWQEKIPFDLFLAVLTTAGILLVFPAESLWLDLLNHPFLMGQQFEEQLYKILLAGIGTLEIVLVTLVLRTLVVRIRAKALLKTTLVWQLCAAGYRFITIFLRYIPLFWKTALLYGLFLLGTLGLMISRGYNSLFYLSLWVLAALILFLLLAWWCIGFQHLRKGARAIAAGDLEHQISSRYLPPQLKEHAEDLNHISIGLNSALEEKIRSERFKAELITNVSHDLKTPLTSIINYVSLLKTTDQTDPRALEYIEVLDRKSQRLKKLTEDLVEASKASTGVLRVEREKIGMSQLIDQACAEWTEKLEARHLTLIRNIPEGETFVQADGRHLWRVLDNLLSNCSKYAMEGTRIYLDLARGKGQITLSVKNISREPLNIPPEQLMERFVRGEESRTSEGSGLGLSIARSLTELQGGTFDLVVDGDLFKAVLTLPQAP